jgi:hypothetical protein
LHGKRIIANVGTKIHDLFFDVLGLLSGKSRRRPITLPSVAPGAIPDGRALGMTGPQGCGGEGKSQDHHSWPDEFHLLTP